MNLKRCFSFLFCLCFLVSSVSFSASADTRYKATSSDATSSNAFVADRLDIEPYSVFNTMNTIDYSGAEVWLQYYDESLGDGILRYSKLPLSSNGVLRTSVYNTSRYDLVAFDIRLRKSSLPPAGKYKFTFDYSADIGPLYWHNSGTLGTKLSYNNASTQFPSVGFTASRYGDDYGFKVNVDIPSYAANDFFFFVIPINWSIGDGAAYRPESVQWGGKLNFNFERLKSDSQVEFSPSDYGDSADSNDSLIAQSSQQIADNTAQIVQGQNQVIEEIQALVQHISDQLFALWQQIYSGIWQPHERLMNRIIDAIDNVHIDITENASNVAQQINKATNDITKSVTDNTSSIIKNNNDNTTSINNKLEDTKQGIVSGILEGLKSLFIPSNEYFKAWFDDIYTFFSDRLGFLMLPIDLLIRLLNIFLSGNVQFTGIPFPELSWDGTIIIPAQQVGFEFLNTEWGKELQNMLYFATDVILIGALLRLMHRKLEEVLRG